MVGSGLMNMYLYIILAIIKNTNLIQEITNLIQEVIMIINFIQEIINIINLFIQTLSELQVRYDMIRYKLCRHDSLYFFKIVKSIFYF